MTTSSPGARYDWTFTYELSKPVFCKESNDDNTIKLVKDPNNNLIGFKIGIENETDSKAAELSEIKKNRLERILIVLSGMELEARLTGEQGVPRKPGLIRVGKTLTLRYNIDGWIKKIDVTDPNIGNLINLEVNPELDYISKAVAHKYHKRYSESIKEAFRVIDEEKSAKHYSTLVKDYDKYKCIRDILSHKEGQRLHGNTKSNFLSYFKPVHDAFDFMYCDESYGVFIFDLDSPKTKQTLEKVAADLISEVRNTLKL
jgi:hypothetical protein